MASVNAWLAKAGYADGMKLTQTTGELFAKYNALTPADDRNAKTNGDRAYWLGELTPRATGRMLEAIEKRALPSKAGAEELLRMMRAQQSGARRLPHFLHGRARWRTRPATSRRCWPTTWASSTPSRARSW